MDNDKLPREVSATELELGDVVEVNPLPYGTATVCCIEEYEVEFFRPYTHHADFTYTGGIICYVGIEKFKTPKTDINKFKLLKKCQIKFK